MRLVASGSRGQLTAHQAPQNEAHHQRRQHQPRILRAVAQHTLAVERQERQRAEKSNADQEAEDDRDGERAALEEVQGQDRLGGTAFPDGKRDQQDRADAEGADDLAGRPWIGDACPGQGDEDGEHSAHQQQDAQPVDVHPTVTAESGQKDHKRSQCHDPEGQVDVEDPAPAEIVGDESADQRANDAAQAEDAHDQAHPASALPGGENIADGRGAERHHGPASNPGNSARGDQLAHVLGEAGYG